MENINVIFSPDRFQSDKQRLINIEDYLGTLSARIKFCFENLRETVKHSADENKNETEKLSRLSYAAIANGVGMFSEEEPTAEIFNDYDGNTASGADAHCEGANNAAKGGCSHCEGSCNTAGAYCDHAEGSNNSLSDESAGINHVEGEDNTLDRFAYGCHVEGSGNTITLNASTGCHVEGSANELKRCTDCHAEGTSNTMDSAARSHAEGLGNTVTNARYSHVGGTGNTVSHNINTVIGKYNVDKDLAFCVGGGSVGARANILELDWNGNLKLSGSLTAQGTSDSEAITIAEIDAMFAAAG